MEFICYPKCTTCRKAKSWLTEEGFSFTERDIKAMRPTYEELKVWWEQSGLPLSGFFNTSGLLYKEYQLKDKLPTMSDEEKLQLLATDGMLVKRPILLNGNTVLVGFKAEKWKEILK